MLNLPYYLMNIYFVYVKHTVPFSKHLFDLF